MGTKLNLTTKIGYQINNYIYIKLQLISSYNDKIMILLCLILANYYNNFISIIFYHT